MELIPADKRGEYTWYSRCWRCGSAQTVFHCLVIGDRLETTDGKFGVYECADCGWVWTNPLPTGNIHTLYPSGYLSPGKETPALMTWYREDQYRFDFALWEQVTGKVLAEQASYLDVGAGSGERVSFVERSGVRRVGGIDRSDQSPAPLSTPIINTAITKYTPTKKFALIGLFHVLEHLPNPQEVLQHLAQHCVSPDGEIIIQVPNYASLERKLFGQHWYGLDIPRHFWHFTPFTVRKLLEDSGWEVEKIEQRNAWLHPVTPMASLWRELDVQRIWVRSKKRPPWQQKIFMLMWMMVTVAMVPWSVFLSFFQQGTMLTVIAKRSQD